MYGLYRELDVDTDRQRQRDKREKDRETGGLGGKEKNGRTVHEQCLNRHVFFTYICMSKCMHDDRLVCTGCWSARDVL